MAMVVRNLHQTVGPHRASPEELVFGRRSLISLQEIVPCLSSDRTVQFSSATKQSVCIKPLFDISILCLLPFYKYLFMRGLSNTTLSVIIIISYQKRVIFGKFGYPTNL